jgi:dolichol-phosphate mannosyltransferase
MMDQTRENKKLSVVVSVYNEEQSLDRFYGVTAEVLRDCRWDYELIFVNDGSSDRSLDILRALSVQDEHVKVVSFSRNFGHEAAMIAGIDHAEGDGIVCMDADLQHPPQSIPAIIDKFEEGYEVISMIRTAREDGGLIKKITSAGFYKVLNFVSPLKFEANASDFFAIARPAADVLRQEYRERVRYLRGYVQSLGFNKTTLEFMAAKREAGESHYNIRKLIRFSISTICSFSDMPLKLGIYSGLAAALIGVIVMIYSLVNKLVNDVPAGYSTIIVVLCFMFAATLLIIGIIGEYIAILFAEVKERPIYIVREVIQSGKAQTAEINKIKRGDSL